MYFKCILHASGSTESHSNVPPKVDDRSSAVEQNPVADKQQQHRSPKRTPPLGSSQSFLSDAQGDKMASLEYGEPPQKMQKRQDSQQSFGSEAPNPISDEPISSSYLDQLPNFMDIADQLDWNQSDLLAPQQTHQKSHHQGIILL